MKIVVAQPRLEKQLAQLEHELSRHPEADAAIFPEGYLNDNLAQACELAKKHSTMIISGSKNPKDRAVIIDRNGKLLLDRAKYAASVVAETEGQRIGFMLCDELVLQGLGSIEPGERIDLVAHPIGVGMFSEEQFGEWIAEAKEIAKKYRAPIIGTSHADGTFRDCEISIPIAYFIGEDGNTIWISKHDVRTAMVDTEAKRVRRS